jgi:hypothetical protein
MKQVYTNTTEKVYFRVYKDGELYNAAAAPAYSVSIVGSSVAPRTGNAATESTGVYSVSLELDETVAEGTLKIDWTYTIDAQPGGKTDYISIVTPYLNYTDLKEAAPDATDKQLEDAETFARFMINSYTGQSFGQYYDNVTIRGNQQSVLVLPHRITRIDQVELNDEIVYTRSPLFNEFGRELIITDTNYGIRARKAETVPSYYDNEIYYPAWNKNSWYKISGLYGWADTPDEVEYAARLLAEDFFCKETAWKKRFVEQINASDWRIVFNQRQFRGTGNFFADQILSKYKSIGMVLV